MPKLPVGPAKGQALSVEGRIVRRVVESPRCYLVPKGTSQTMVGATVERAGFDTANTLSGLAEICTGGMEISPRLGECSFINAWAGLRPVAPDELPVIGPFSGLPNVLAATAHFRNGILLAPITAQLVKGLVVGEDPLFDIAQFLPDRDFVL